MNKANLTSIKNKDIKQIKFNIDKKLYPKVVSFEDNELDIIAKQLFDDWYQKKYAKNMDFSDQFHKYENKIKEEIDDKFLIVTNNINELNKTTKDLFGISQNSQKKGEMMENIIFDYFQNNLQNYTFIKTNQIPHNADGHIITPDKQDILLEIKNYQGVVDKKEIEKLKFDMQYTKIKYGLFLSIQSGIVGKKTIDIEYFNDKEENTYYIIYVSYVLDEQHKIQSGISILETIYKFNTIYKNTRLNYIEDKLLDNLKDISLISDVITNLRKQYQTLEGKIKDNMDDYYQLIRDNEISIKQKINTLWENITTDLEKTKEILIKYDDYDTLLLELKTESPDCYSIMTRICDMLIKHKCNIIDKQYIYYQTLKIGEYKLYQKKVELTIYKPNISVKFSKKTDGGDYKFMECIIQQNKKN